MPIVDLSIEGKVAIVTGGSKGIGRAIALAFAEHGADLTIAARGAEALDRTRQEIAATGRRALTVQADIGKDGDIEKIYRETVAQFGGVDILVNNAAAGDSAGLLEMTQDQFMAIMKANVWAPLNLSRICRESMIKRGGGVIINIVSNEGIRPSIGLGIYPASKAALMNMTQLIAKEWAQDGIRVMCIAPGLIRTELAKRLVDAVEASGTSINPLKRIGEAHEIAGMALLLASPAGSYATGMTYVIDGGEICSGAGDLMLSD